MYECVYVCVCLPVCDLETSTVRRRGLELDCCARANNCDVPVSTGCKLSAIERTEGQNRRSCIDYIVQNLIIILCKTENYIVQNRIIILCKTE
jgi:hypothetical protein